MKSVISETDDNPVSLSKNGIIYDTEFTLLCRLTVYILPFCKPIKLMPLLISCLLNSICVVGAIFRAEVNTTQG